MSEYPEHDKLIAVYDQSQAVGEFLEWVNNTYHAQLAHIPDGLVDTMLPLSRSTSQLLAEFFEIDPNLLEKEKRAMLAELRKPR